MKNNIARRTAVILSIATLSLSLAAMAQAQDPAVSVSAQPQTVVTPRVRLPQHQPNRLSRQGLTPRAQSPALSTAVSPDVIWVQCPPEAQALGATCGKLPVPLDRQQPGGEKIEIYFQLYLHTNPGPAQSAILLNTGGPGVSTTYVVRILALPLFARNLDVHDFLLIDDRGRGFSAAINCTELQHGTAPFSVAEADCASQLGHNDSRYGTGDVAMDTEAVRVALGYDKLDYWGASYGGEDVTAYATRFGQHLRSIVLDAPDGTPALQAFLVGGNEAGATARAVRLACARSPTCSRDHPNPDSEFVQLIQAIRNDPIEGPARDASGNLVPVTLDEAALLYLAINETGNFVSTGELLAAGDSLSHGDPAPLLRLGAEVTPLVTDYGDPTIYSQGDYFATLCVDAHEPWDWSSSIPHRQMRLADAVSDLPFDHFAPFSNGAGTSLEVSPEKQCLWWQKPTPSSPVTLPTPTYPNVPTLVLDGDMDTIVPMEEVQQVAALFPGSTFIPVAEAGHVSAYWTQCAANIESQFFETLQVGDTSCTRTPETVWPAVGRFPLIAADAWPAEADPAGTNEIDVAERRVVTVAVATITDALKRASIGSGNGVGLRGGAFQSTVDANGNQTMVLTNCAFAQDVTVSGSVVWGANKSLIADLTVSGTRELGGRLQVVGTWQAPGPVGNFKVSGTLDGDAVAVLVPEE
jgi:pimeloyl-ACP methyl ester carboxylesterase